MGTPPDPHLLNATPTMAKFYNETLSNPTPQHCVFADGSRSEDMDGEDMDSGKPVSRN